MGWGMPMTKRATLFLILVTGLVTFAVVIYIGGPPTLNLTTIFVQMILYAGISAAISVAMTPGRWRDKFARRAARQRKLPHWIWPTFFAFLAVANYLAAIAVLLGRLPFTPRRQTVADFQQPVD